MGNNNAKRNLSYELINALRNPPTSIGDIERLINRGADVNRPDDDTFPLHCACRYNGIHCLQLLLHYGADVNKVNNNLQTALHCVAKSNSFILKFGVECITLLIQYNADVNVRDGQNRTPLHLAVDNIEYVKLLLRHGADSNVPDKDKNTPFHCAVAVEDCVEVVELFLQHGADVNARSRYNNTPFHCAVATINVECVNILLKHGVDINARGRYNNTPLHCAIESDKTDYSIPHYYGRMPFDDDMICFRNEEYSKLKCVKILLQHGADVNARGRCNNTPLHCAVSYNEEECVKSLLQHGADVNVRDEDNNTLLHCAVATNKKEWVEIVLQHGANTEVLDNNHDTALSKAAGHCYLDIIKILLDYSSNVNTINLDGKTPLMLAAIRVSELNTERGKVCVELLIQASGQFDLRDKKGELILDIACDNELSEMLRPYSVLPRSLQAFCRHQIRSSLRNQFLPDIITLLHLPKRLQRFVLLQR